MKKYITPKRVRTSRPAIAGIVTLILLLVCLLLSWKFSTKLHFHSDAGLSHPWLSNDSRLLQLER